LVHGVTGFEIWNAEMEGPVTLRIRNRRFAAFSKFA
jgi:hypothetical protein